MRREGGALKDTDAIFALQITDEITAPGRGTFGKAYPTTVRHALISKTQQPKSNITAATETNREPALHNYSKEHGEWNTHAKPIQ